MDQIRPIGPVERDIDPVFAAERIARDGGGRGRDERPERQPRREPRAPEPPHGPDAPPDDNGSGSLIDIRV